MTLTEYYALLADLPRPTEAQLKRFAHHVCRAHSWYKYLPFEGAEFVVFVDPYAGGGFTEAQPRLHHTWGTRAQYLERFGHLSYMFRPWPSSPFTADYVINARVELKAGVGHYVDQRITPVLPIPYEIHRDGGFTLYPFAWDNYVFFSRFEEQLRQLSEGHLHHPCESLLIDYYRGHVQSNACATRLYDEIKGRYVAGVPCRGQLVALSGGEPREWDYWWAERKFILGLAREAETRASLSESELAFALAEHEYREAEWRMQKQERAKIAAALNRLMLHVAAAREELV